LTTAKASAAKPGAAKPARVAVKPSTAMPPKDPLPGVPLIESPFFERLFASLKPDAETRRIAHDLRAKGFAVFDFPEPEFDRISEEIIETYGPRVPWEQWREKGGDHRVQDAWRFDPNVKRIAANPRVLKLLQTLYGRPAIPFQTLNFPVGTQQPIHSDNIHFSSVPEPFMCGVWVALEDIDESNGPLLYYPGSHKWPNFFNEEIGFNPGLLSVPHWHYTDYERLWQELIELYGAVPERFVARKGQALIWASHLWHGGDTHRDRSRTRYSQVTHYYFDGCCYYTPLHSNPFYGAIQFRDIVNIETNKRVPNTLGGRRVPRWFIHQSRLRSYMHGLLRLFTRR
jgi:hypothetical protein